MTILIIGSCGFIGSHAVSYFKKKQHQIFGCDIVPSSAKNIVFIQVRSDADYTLIFTKQKYDVCINAGGSATVGYSYQNPYIDFVLNSVNVCKILEAIRILNPQCKFINLSSASVYGNLKIVPVDENAPLNPISPYAYNKLCSDLICASYHEMFGINTCSLRIFSVYGPGLRKQILWDIYQKSLSNEVIELSGTGDETRDFIFIDDLCYAIECTIKNALFNGKPINVGTGIATTIRKLANDFIQILCPEKKIKFNNTIRVGDPSNWRSDISLLKSMGFNPDISLDQGLTRYTRWLKNL